MATGTSPSHIDLPGALSSAVELLRREWRAHFDGYHAQRATRAIQFSRSLAVDTELAFALARIESKLDIYLTLPLDHRSKELPAIANAIKAAQNELNRAKGQGLQQMGPTQSAPAQPARPKTLVPQLPLDAVVTRLPRIGPAVAKKLEKLSIHTVGDVLRTVPRRHVDYSKTLSIRDASSFSHRGEVTIRGTVVDVTSYPGPPPRVTIRMQDRTGALRVTWFNRYIDRQIRTGDDIAVSGVLDHGYGSPAMTSPEWEKMGQPSLSTGRLTPVYHLTQGIAQKTMRSLTRSALDATRTTLSDPLPAWVGSDNGLMPLAAAFEEAHYPKSEQNLRLADRRLAFDDLFLLQLGLVRVKQSRQSSMGIPLHVDRHLLEQFIASLPFSLTTGQSQALQEVTADLAQPRPMVRLLQGDVGSGKTVVAAAAALITVAQGYQVAMMAPTEILAEQHYASVQMLFASLPEGVRPAVSLLTGSTPKRDRTALMNELVNGNVDVLIGTHALIQKGVDFKALGLVIVDEQHRFGVRQRSHLPSSVDGPQPHLLSMTATPIPRTLNMVLNGDTDVSVIAELPKGRVPVETRRYTPDELPAAYELVRSEIGAGRQAFVICPLVEESEASDAKAAVTEADRLQQFVFPELRVQVLHGRMSGRDKDAIMSAFRDREYDILVSTSVIEVGIDIPNATIMMIEGANHFGLAQLHQFRGRVGRGAHRSYCLLVADESSAEAEQRLGMMIASNDGFALAEKDLELRGPGDFIGTRQSGLPEMQSVVRAFDTRLLDAARRSAEKLLAADPLLSNPEHAPLVLRLKEFWAAAAPDLALG